MGIEQRTIATVLGLSEATVSRSLSNHPAIKAETRARVLEKAAELGYESSSRKRGGRSRRVSRGGKQARPRMVGVFFLTGHAPEMDVSDLPGLNYLTGISSVAAEMGVSPVVHYVTIEELDELVAGSSQSATIRFGRLEGLVLIHNFPRHVVSRLAELMPCCGVVYDHPGIRMDHVDMDTDLIMERVVGRLVELGHRKIGYLGRSDNLRWDANRRSSYRRALDTFDLPILKNAQLIMDIADIRQDCPDRKWGRDMMELIRRGVRAWVTPCDRVGYSAWSYLSSHGVSIPAEISLAGVNGIEPMFGLGQLFTARPPFFEMGVAALRQVLHRIEYPASQSRRILLGVNFIDGVSIGPPLRHQEQQQGAIR